MCDQRDKAFVRESIDQGLSSLKENPFLAQRVLAQANGKEEIVVKKKITVSFVLVAVLLLLMTSAALAAGFGLFGQLSEGQNNDKRLPQLEQVAESVTSEIDTDRNVKLEIGQAYYEGDRVFMSYRLSGDLNKAVLHEGKPEQTDIVWDTELENFVVAEEWESDFPEIQKANAWLDGKEERWAETWVYCVEDGLYLEDGTYLDIIGGDQTVQADGSILGWKECVIPADHLADQLTFKALLFSSSTVEWQSGTTYRADHFRNNVAEAVFTLNHNERYTFLNGEGTNDRYQAAVTLKQGQIDLKGSVTVKGPADWIAHTIDFDGNGSDLLLGWNLYQNGKLISRDGVQNISCPDANTARFVVLWPYMNDLNGLSLVPEYTQSGEHADEALTIQSIRMD